MPQIDSPSLASSCPRPFRPSGTVDLAAKNRLPTSVRMERVCRCGRPHGLWAEPCRFVSARRDLRRQDPQGRQARRSPGGAARSAIEETVPHGGPGDGKAGLWTEKITPP